MWYVARMEAQGTPTKLEDVEITHRFADLAEVRLHYAEAGRASDPLVVLLHGFPEHWYSWRHQIPALARAGFRVIAPDMRGYNLSSKPEGVRAYRSRKLAQDIVELVHAVGATRARIVGHDWGGGVAWCVAMWHPDIVEQLAVLNCPHPLRMMRGFSSLGQLKKSWYMFFFQLPMMPERAIARHDFAFVRKVLRRDTVRRDAFSDEDIERYVEALSQPGALTAMINYYRAMMQRDIFVEPRRMRRVDVPVLVVWGEQDSALGSELATPPARWVARARVERIPDASHWVQVDRPEVVNEQLLKFFREP